MTSRRDSGEGEEMKEMAEGKGEVEQKAGGAMASGGEMVFVFIDGLFGRGLAKSMRHHLKSKFPRCNFFSVHCGAVSSVQDRAVECFWQLKGGQADFQVDGVELEYGHGRHGETYPGLLPEWSEERPIHILAYSYGASTARCLQHLLERGCFSDPRGRIHTSGAWIRSLVTLHGTNEGSLAVHLVGLSPWSLSPLPMSILWWIFTIIYCIVWLDNDALNSACGLRLRHWKAQRRKSAEDKEGISLARLLWWRPGTTDNAGRDLSSQRMTELNKMFAQTLPHPSTRYIACYGVAFAPAVAAAHKGGTPRFFGLHLPCRCLLSQLPFALFLLPLGMIQSLAGFLSRLLLTFVQWVEPKGIGSIRKSNVVSQTQTAAPKEECEIQLFTSTSKATHKQGAARPPSDDSISDASTGSLSSGEEECGAERHGAEGSVSVVGGVQGGRRGAKEMSSLGVRSRMPELELGNLFEECAQNDASAQVSVKHPAHYDNTQEETIPEKWQPKRADWRIHHAPELEPTVAVGGWGGLGLGFVAYGKSCLSEVVCVVVGAVGKLGGGGEVGNPSEAKARRWNDSEANDGVLSVAAQKAPASECKGAAPREFDSVASLRAAYGAEGSGAAPLGVWTQVLMGFHDHIKITRDGAWQRDFLHDLCLCIILLEGETAPVDANR